MFELNRGNLAYNFCACLNLNTFFEMPRQIGKTTSICARYLYIYNFSMGNTKMALLHKNMGGAKDNLDQIRNMRDMLPDYLQMKEFISPDGKLHRGKNNATELLNPVNNNDIKTFGSATNRTRAASTLRGKSLSNIWIDEVAFLQFNSVVYMNGAPAFNTAKNIARANNAPFGFTFSTTPGFMSTDYFMSHITVMQCA